MSMYFMMLFSTTCAALRVGAPVMCDSKLPCHAPRTINGGTLRTWTYQSCDTNRLQIAIANAGRPFDTDIELWHGPDNTPCKIRVYSQDGKCHGFKAVVQTPHYPNTIAIQNIGLPEFPFSASVSRNVSASICAKWFSDKSPTQIQGQALRTYSFSSQIGEIHFFLATNGNPLNGRIELLQGPNTNKQVIEFYSEDGIERPIFCSLQTSGIESVVRLINTGPVEFPILVTCVT